MISCRGNLYRRKGEVKSDGIILSEQDLHLLTEIMRPAIPQWKTLGGPLGFRIQVSDLNITQPMHYSFLNVPRGTSERCSAGG